MSIVLETCTACHGTGWEVYSFSSMPLAQEGVKERCWSCDGTGQVLQMLNRAELREFIAGEHGKETA